MKTHYNLYHLLLALSLLLGLLGMGSTALAQNCPHLIDETLPTGSRWEMCWEQRAQEGIVLSNVYFTTPTGIRRRVLKEAALAQIHVAFDDASARLEQLTDVGAGLGFANINDLDSADCPNGDLLLDNTRWVVCQSIIERGYIYKSYNLQKQGYALNLLSKSTLSLNTYIIQWRFSDDGTIEPAIGFSGHLPAIGNNPQYGWAIDENNTIGKAFTNNYYWRMDFDIGVNSNDDVVEEIEITPSADRLRKTIAVNTLTTETGRNFNPDRKRSWRIRDGVTTNADGRAISYHLEPLQTGHFYASTSSEPWAAYDFYITQFKACEKFASSNPSNNCGTSLADFVSGESINTRDVVLWYRITQHILPRAEDNSIMPIRWIKFQIVPRDWTATNPLAFNVLDKRFPTLAISTKDWS